jgi:hypothetical protein
VVGGLVFRRRDVVEQAVQAPVVELVDAFRCSNLRRVAISLAESAIPSKLACARRCNWNAATVRRYHGTRLLADPG